MKNITLYTVLLLCLASIAACSDFETQREQDERLIEEYITENNLDAQETTGGVYYVVEEEGNGEFPVFNSVVTVNYEGYFLNGFVFDSSYDNGNPITLALAGTIAGWQVGIPEFSKGGKGKLIIPSAYGYGGYGSGVVPPNTVLVFDIELVDFD